jgi:hypothetical protein
MKKFYSILIRIVVLLPIAVVSFYLQDPFYSFLIKTLHYQEPSSFFGFNLYVFGIGWVLSWMFWSGIVYGSMGKKIDMIFLALIFIFSVWNVYATENVTPIIYLGLIGVALVGSAIGFGIKLIRQRFLMNN